LRESILRADPATVRIQFDRGTLLLKSSKGVGVPADLPGVRWDPRVDCHRAPARFYSRIVERLGAMEVLVEDDVLAHFPCPTVTEEPNLRPYQAAAVDAWRLAGRQGIVSLPTGSGKTFVAVSIIASVGASALCLVPTRILLEQWQRVLNRALSLDVGCYGDGVREARPVTVATFESAWRHMRELGNRFELLIVDEVHHFGSGLRDEALDMSTAGCRLGLTATPHKQGVSTALLDLIGPVVFELAIADLAGSYLASFEVIDLHLDLTREERDEYESARRTFTAVFNAHQDLAPGATWNDFLRWAGRTPQGRDAVSAWHRARKVLSFTRAKRDMLCSLLQRV
jgi:superfamily II DNA or RNA helicase